MARPGDRARTRCDSERRGTAADYVPADDPDLTMEDGATLRALRTQLRKIPVEAVPGEDHHHGVAVVRHLRIPDQSVLETALSRPKVAEVVAAALLELDPADYGPGGQDVLALTPYPA